MMGRTLGVTSSEVRRARLIDDQSRIITTLDDAVKRRRRPLDRVTHGYPPREGGPDNSLDSMDLIFDVLEGRFSGFGVSPKSGNFWGPETSNKRTCRQMGTPPLETCFFVIF